MDSKLSIREFLAEQLGTCSLSEMQMRGPCVSYERGNRREYDVFNPFENPAQKDAVEQYAMRTLESIRIQKKRVIAVSSKGMPFIEEHNNSMTNRTTAFLTAIARALGWQNEF